MRPHQKPKPKIPALPALEKHTNPEGARSGARASRLLSPVPSAPPIAPATDPLSASATRAPERQARGGSPRARWSGRRLARRRRL
jgi:hypothetical protein